MDTKSTQRRAGGVELSFNAMLGKAHYKLADAEGTDGQQIKLYYNLYLALTERFAGSIKGFISHNFGNTELYITCGIKVKNIKYRCIENFSASANAYDDASVYTQPKKKTHVKPIIGFGSNLYLDDGWFIRGEYTFEFPVRLSLGSTNDPFINQLECKHIKHNMHNIKVGIGKMF